MSAHSSNGAVLELDRLRAFFYTRNGIVKAVNRVSFRVEAGQTLGIVGESGSGKSVCQLSYLGLAPSPPLKILGGSARFKGVELLTLSSEQLRKLRGNRIGVIFQEPMTSLNPYLRIGTQLIEPLRIHTRISKAEAWSKGIAALERVGIDGAKNAMRAYPHEFSGGMRQRVMIAMALTTSPDLLIADEPTTALDVTVQAQILGLLKSLQKETGMAIILVTHDLGVIAQMADRVAVMYAGQILEEAEVGALFEYSRHPYTRALIECTPRIDLSVPLRPIPGQIPDLTTIGEGCPFASRCENVIDICRSRFPESTVRSWGTTYCHNERKS